VDLPDDLGGDGVCAHDVTRQAQHRCDGTGQDERRRQPQPGARERAEPRHALLEEPLGEAQVTRLLGHVDLHDAPDERVLGAAVPRQGATLDPVDGRLAGEHVQEEHLGERAPQARHAPRAERLQAAEAAHVETAPVDELLEHQRVLRLLDHLVVRVAELGRAVRPGRRELEEPAAQHRLELDARLHHSHQMVEAEPGARRRRERAVPPGRRQGVVVGQLEARIVVVDGVLGVVPRDVAVRLVVLGHRASAQAAQEIDVGLAMGGK
jgi:hypothetical protein